jgi:hypothetical protein
MASPKKLSIYLNRYHSYHHYRDVNSDDIAGIIQDYIAEAKELIFKQPANALRSIKVEMVDILVHYERYEKENLESQESLYSIVSKGPKLEKEKYEIAVGLGEKVEKTANFLVAIEEVLGNLTRMLLEHYSEEEIGTPFLSKFSKFLGPFDWVGKRVNYILERKNRQGSPFSEEIIDQARHLIAEGQLRPALGLLLSNAQEPAIRNELTMLMFHWVEATRKWGLEELTDDEYVARQEKLRRSLLEGYL